MLLGLWLRDKSLSPQQHLYGCLTMFVEVVIGACMCLEVGVPLLAHNTAQGLQQSALLLGKQAEVAQIGRLP